VSDANRTARLAGKAWAAQVQEKRLAFYNQFNYLSKPNTQISLNLTASGAFEARVAERHTPWDGRRAFPK
jgi:hypothetical protein